MPGFTLPLNPLADGLFPLQMKQIPIDWKQPQGKDEQDHYVKAFDRSELASGGPPHPGPYYFNATPNKYHADAAKEVSKWHKDFVHTALDKIKQAVDTWKVKAKFKDLKVMALSAIGTPGCLDGPNIKNEPSFSSWIGAQKNEKAYIKAVIDGFSKQWMDWADNVMVPGLPWYPAFVAFPGPQAAPMPNVPMPLITCPSPKMASMAVPQQIKSAMVDALDSGVKKEDKDKQHEAIFEVIATPVATAFTVWLASQQVMNVLGKGPIPSFAPPFVPVGPVVMGDNVAVPGHLAT